MRDKRGRGRYSCDSVKKNVSDTRNNATQASLKYRNNLARKADLPDECQQHTSSQIRHCPLSTRRATSKKSQCTSLGRDSYGIRQWRYRDCEGTLHHKSRTTVQSMATTNDEPVGIFYAEQPLLTESDDCYACVECSTKPRNECAERVFKPTKKKNTGVAATRGLGSKNKPLFQDVELNVTAKLQTNEVPKDRSRCPMTYKRRGCVSKNVQKSFLSLVEAWLNFFAPRRMSDLSGRKAFFRYQMMRRCPRRKGFETPHTEGCVRHHPIVIKPAPLRCGTRTSQINAEKTSAKELA